LNEHKPNIRTLNVVQDKRGFWAHDDGNGYTIVQYDADNARPYLLTCPLMADTGQPPWEDAHDDHLWGEPCWGQIDDEDYLRQVERALIAFWTNADKPTAAAHPDLSVVCERCGELGTLETMRDSISAEDGVSSAGPIHCQEYWPCAQAEYELVFGADDTNTHTRDVMRLVFHSEKDRDAFEKMARKATNVDQESFSQ